MGEGKRMIEILKTQMQLLKDSHDQIFKIQRDQAILISVLITKGGITQNDIEKETTRLNAKLEERTGSFESSEVQSEGTRPS